MKKKSVYDRITEPLDNIDYSFETGNISGIDELMTDEDVRNREAFEAVGKQFKAARRSSGRKKYPGAWQGSV